MHNAAITTPTTPREEFRARIFDAYDTLTRFVYCDAHVLRSLEQMRAALPRDVIGDGSVGEVLAALAVQRAVDAAVQSAADAKLSELTACKR